MSKKLHEKDERFRAYYKQAPSPIIIFDRKGIIVEINSIMEKEFGYKPEEVYGKNFLELGLFRPEMVPVLMKRLRIYASGDKPEPIELEMKTQDGSYVWLSPEVSLIDIDGEKYIEIIAQDISLKKDAEKRLIESEKNYKKAYTQVNLYKDLLSHDINNIFQNIRYAVELTKMYKENPQNEEDFHDSMQIISEQIIRGSKLISNIRHLSELEEGKIKLSEIDLYEALLDAKDYVQQSYQNRNIEFNIESENKKTELTVKANELLQDIFENIFVNAVKYNEHIDIYIGISIIKTSKDGQDFIKTAIEDNGIGIEDEQKEIIFKENHKNHNSKGMGLGLSLVKKTLDLYDGDIWVENRVSGDFKKGSKFVLLIPKP